tara:strand:- start:251 stop:445 length:195 start_codon:yes stop_codon:yes gene_type:complete
VVKIKYFVDGKQFVERFKEHIPRKGELVRFKKIVYVVVTIVYVEEGEDPFVSMDLVKETYNVNS